MLMDGSAWVSFFTGVKSGGSFHTLLLGVIMLFRVRAHWLPILVSVGASLATVPSKRTMMRGFAPLRQLVFTYPSENTRRTACCASFHWVSYSVFGMNLPVDRSVTSRVCLSTSRCSS